MIQYEYEQQGAMTMADRKKFKREMRILKLKIMNLQLIKKSLKGVGL
jgi:hypothetical protein